MGSQEQSCFLYTREQKICPMGINVIYVVFKRILLVKIVYRKHEYILNLILRLNITLLIQCQGQFQNGS